MKEITKLWLEYAEKDLLLAKRNVDSKDFPELIAFHLQQAVEKVLKAYIKESIDKEPPKIHNLIGLLSISGIELNKEERLLLDDLNFVYTESRYPQSINELKEFLESINLMELYNRTERLIEWIKAKL
ncbi:MAG: HEPN domain-containing protein [Candidatus Melainabacteria bacterium]|nr:HEPN domain-containing protein [Candidatus Melainabacteria bacterium]